MYIADAPDAWRRVNMATYKQEISIEEAYRLLTNDDTLSNTSKAGYGDKLYVETNYSSDNRCNWVVNSYSVIRQISYSESYDTATLCIRYGFDKIRYFVVNTGLTPDLGNRIYLCIDQPLDWEEPKNDEDFPGMIIRDTEDNIIISLNKTTNRN